MGHEMEEMKSETGRRPEEQSDNDAREYLTNLHCLAGELNHAMAAIVAQELPSLRESLHVQRSTCARLSDLQQSPNVRQMLSTAADADTAGCDLSTEIKAATESLLALNRRYSALLTHAGETLRMLSGLYRGYLYQGHQGHEGHARTALAPQSGTQSWYCEV